MLSLSLLRRVVKEEIVDESKNLPALNGRIVSWVYLYFLKLNFSFQIMLQSYKMYIVGNIVGDSGEQ